MEAREREQEVRYAIQVAKDLGVRDQALTLHGVAIPKDSKIQLLYPSANRDPSVFSDPDRFSLERDLVTLLVAMVLVDEVYLDVGEKAKARAEYETALRLPVSDVNDSAYKAQARAGLARI